jgi:hypothetical protein
MVETNSELPKRSLKFNIDGNWFTLNSLNYKKTPDMSLHVYETLSSHREYAVLLEQSKEAFRIAQEAEDIEAQANEVKFLQRQAQESFDRYQEMLIEQHQLTEETARLREAEKMREDENRIALVRGISLDPNTAPAALASEFGFSGDIRRQVADVMERDINISKQVVQLPESLWISSYEIMDVIGSQCSQDHKFAQEVADKLPDDSSLKITLKSFGWAK